MSRKATVSSYGMKIPQSYNTFTERDNPSQILARRALFNSPNISQTPQKTFSDVFLEKIKKDYDVFIGNEVELIQPKNNEIEIPRDRKYRFLKTIPSSSTTRSIDITKPQFRSKSTMSKSAAISNKTSTTKLPLNFPTFSASRPISPPKLFSSTNENKPLKSSLSDNKEKKNVMFLKYVPNNPIEKEIGFNEESFEKEHEQRIKEAEERLLMEQMEEMKKQEKTKLLYSISKQKRDEKKIEMINIGLACHQEWAMIRCQSPTTRNKKFDKRPITATTKEALKELDEFDKKLREKEKNVVFLDVT